MTQQQQQQQSAPTIIQLQQQQQQQQLHQIKFLCAYSSIPGKVIYGKAIHYQFI
jgi:hypothetical protein